VNISDIKISNYFEVEGLLSESPERKVNCDQRPHPAMTPKIGSSIISMKFSAMDSK
jgi:hypothetical protein